MELIWTRESVCMGDDCMAPNMKKETVDMAPTVPALLTMAADYVPKMPDSVWVVLVEHDLVGYLSGDSSGAYQIEACQGGVVPSLSRLHIHCDYFYEAYFCGGGQQQERYPECRTLLEKVKKAVGERKAENG